MIKPETQAETGFFATSVSRNGHSDSSFSTTHSDEMGKNKGFHQSPIFLFTDCERSIFRKLFNLKVLKHNAAGKR